MCSSLDFINITHHGWNCKEQHTSRSYLHFALNLWQNYKCFPQSLTGTQRSIKGRSLLTWNVEYSYQTQASRSQLQRLTFGPLYVENLPSEELPCHSFQNENKSHSPSNQCSLPLWCFLICCCCLFFHVLRESTHSFMGLSFSEEGSHCKRTFNMETLNEWLGTQTEWDKQAIQYQEKSSCCYLNMNWTPDLTENISHCHKRPSEIALWSKTAKEYKCPWTLTENTDKSQDCFVWMSLLFIKKGGGAPRSSRRWLSSLL